MERRAFLQFAAGGLAGVAASGAVSAQQGGVAKLPRQTAARTEMNREAAFDVVVCGGGVSGVAAAISAARAGARTALIEKSFMFGGLATEGLITWYPPLDDGLGHQVTFGLSEELLLAGMKYGPGWVYGNWATRKPDEKAEGRFSTHIEPACFILAVDELLSDAGVDVWLDTRVCMPVLDGNRLRAIEVENRDGRILIEAAGFVDATGDALVAHRAGAPCSEVDHPLEISVRQASPKAAAKVAQRGYGAGLDRLHLKAGKDAGRFRGTSAKDVSRFVQNGRRLLREHYASKQGELDPDGPQKLYPVVLPGLPQIRKTRRIEGRGAIAWQDANKEIADGVGLVSNWYVPNKNEVWQVPYGALVPRDVSGLLTVGRCVSAADGRGWDMLRTIQACALTGEVAGLASALGAAADTTADRLDVADVQGALDKRGIAYRFDQIG